MFGIEYTYFILIGYKFLDQKILRTLFKVGLKGPWVLDLVNTKGFDIIECPLEEANKKAPPPEPR